MGTRITVVGGGSTYTPELVEGFARRADRLPIDELVLLDIDPDRLEVVGGLARGCSTGSAGRAACTLTGDRDAAIDGADFVLFQLRVGGQAARLVDETLPLRFGVIGQETTGAGGFAKALRTVPVVLDLAELAARRAAPGRLDRRLHEPGRHRHPGAHRRRASGDRPVQRRDHAPAAVGRPVRRRARSGSSWSTSGSTTSPGSARCASTASTGCPTCSTRTRPSWPRSSGLPADMIRCDRRHPVLLPALLLPDPDRARGAARRAHARARTSWTSRRGCSRCTATRRSPRSRRCSTDRGGAFYSEAAAQLIASLHDGAGDVQVVDVRNDGAIPDLPADAVVEIPARIDRDGAHPLPARAAGPGAARAGPGRQGLRGADDRGRAGRATGRGRAPGARREPARRRPRSPRRCSTRCSRRTAHHLDRFAPA